MTLVSLHTQAKRTLRNAGLVFFTDIL